MNLAIYTGTRRHNTGGSMINSCNSCLILEDMINNPELYEDEDEDDTPCNCIECVNCRNEHLPTSPIEQQEEQK